MRSHELDIERTKLIGDGDNQPIFISMNVKHDAVTATMAALRAFMQKISMRNDFAGAILFGSRARGSHMPESDADVAALLAETPGEFVRTKLEFDGLAYEVLLDTGVRIQPLPVWQSEWEYPKNYPNPHLLKNIAREGIRL